MKIVIYTLLVSALLSFPQILRGDRTESKPAALRFDTWAAEQFFEDELADPKVSGRNADPDKDGMSNILEYALGCDPILADSHLAYSVQRVGKSMRYTFKVDTTRTDVSVVAEVSENLALWSPTTPTVVSVRSNIETRMVAPRADARAFFVRLRVAGK